MPGGNRLLQPVASRAGAVGRGNAKQIKSLGGRQFSQPRF
jgi:hypothetical protein